jgi:hypothetical protein
MESQPGFSCCCRVRKGGSRHQLFAAIDHQGRLGAAPAVRVALADWLLLLPAGTSRRASGKRSSSLDRGSRPADSSSNPRSSNISSVMAGT